MQALPSLLDPLLSDQYAWYNYVQQTERDSNEFIKNYVISDTAKEWKCKDKAKQLPELTDVLRFYFPSLAQPEDPTLPQLLLAIKDMRIDVLGAYRLVPNGNGLPYETILNEYWIGRPEWEIAIRVGEKNLAALCLECWEVFQLQPG